MQSPPPASDVMRGRAGKHQALLKRTHKIALCGFQSPNQIDNVLSHSSSQEAPMFNLRLCWSSKKAVV